VARMSGFRTLCGKTEADGNRKNGNNFEAAA
jgi:hypothetical protein